MPARPGPDDKNRSKLRTASRLLWRRAGEESGEYAWEPMTEVVLDRSEDIEGLEQSNFGFAQYR
jgi:hypothetical protein